MTGSRNKYLEMLKAEKSKKCPGEEPSKPSKIALRSSLNNFEGFEGTQVGAFSEFSPPLDAEGCPATCAQLAAAGSSGVGRGTTKTMTPPAGSAGSALPRPRVVAPATFAACPRTTNDNKRTSNGQASS